MTPILRRLALAGLLLAPLAATPALAQTPTPEGTTITNTATATWSDANGNSYTPATASVSVTVGFAAGVDVVSPATATPLSPSTGNEQAFVINNGGNGVDSVSVGITAGAGVTVTGYKIGSTTYATLADLNTALAGTPISPAPAGGITVTVVYTVASGQAGQNIPLGLTATSRRTPANADTSTTTLSPIAVAGISVTPDGGTVSRLPSNGTQYTATYTLTNPGGVGGTFNLAASTANGAVLTIVSVNGTAGASGSIAVGAGATQTVDVVYTIATGAAAGSTAGLTLAATSSTNPATTDTGSYTVTVIGASVSMTKEVFRDNQTTAVAGTDRVLPGEYVQYRITVTNTGASAASNVSVSDPLPAQVTYQAASGDAAGWTIGESSGTVTAGLASLAPAASRFFWIRVRVK
jgi:uncharacterized repeat protein (TIGR01451 family)